MPPKKDAKASAKAPAKKDGGGGKAKKKKWSKGKVRDKLNNLVLYDKATYDKLYKEVPSYKLITPSVVSERLKIRGSLARSAKWRRITRSSSTLATSKPMTMKPPNRRDSETLPLKMILLLASGPLPKQNNSGIKNILSTICPFDFSIRLRMASL